MKGTNKLRILSIVALLLSCLLLEWELHLWQKENARMTEVNSELLTVMQQQDEALQQQGDVLEKEHRTITQQEDVIENQRAAIFLLRHTLKGVHR